jgi:hypothetical protein
MRDCFEAHGGDYFRPVSHTLKPDSLNPDIKNNFHFPYLLRSAALSGPPTSCNSNAQSTHTDSTGNIEKGALWLYTGGVIPRNRSPDTSLSSPFLHETNNKATSHDQVSHLENYQSQSDPPN